MCHRGSMSLPEPDVCYRPKCATIKRTLSANPEKSAANVDHLVNKQKHVSLSGRLEMQAVLLTRPLSPIEEESPEGAFHLPTSAIKEI
jgi:hypothetical protein